MLEIRPNCEFCNTGLPPDSQGAMICTYECTFCAQCVETVLHNVCPNCGGGFAPRPIRPKNSWRPTTGLGRHPASTVGVTTQYSREEIAAFSEAIRNIPPHQR